MNDTVKLVLRDRVALVVIDNPPVNALGVAVRERVAECLSAVRDDDSVDAVVIACAGRTFSSGADISEFGTGKQFQEPILLTLCATLDSFPKPTVAALHGMTLGGGLELAMSCHYRVAAHDTKLGLPEVKLGILPGSGGVVRLLRLAGPEKTLRMVAGGDRITAGDALDHGIIDAISPGDTTEFAVDFARGLLAKGGDHIPVSRRTDRIGDDYDTAAFEAVADAVRRRSRGLKAPLACIQAVRDAMALPFEAAVKKTRETALELVKGEESRALRHLFFAERQAQKIAGPRGDPRAVESVGIVGAGTMGGGIAMAFANAGIPVTLLDLGDDALSRGMATIRRNYDVSVGRGSLQESEMLRRLGRIEPTTRYEDLAPCDLIIEAVVEDQAAKRAVFEKCMAVCRRDALLASNTSYLDINEFLDDPAFRPNLLGMHFFSPANVMKLVEVVRGDDTSPEALATAVAVAKRIGKIPVVVGVCNGFVGNRMLAARGAELDHLLLEGATPQQVDKAFVGFGWTMGPFQIQDLAGLDIGWSNRKRLGRKAPIADALCEGGRFGQKTGRGFYAYDPGSRVPKPDEEVGRLIDRQREALGFVPRDISDDEIIERTHYPMINEGFRILEEGIAARPSDIDVIWANGYGFPVSKGGPLFWAETKGWREIADRLRYWNGQTGRELYAPAPLLLERAGGVAQEGA